MTSTLPAVGSPAPDFSLDSTSGATVTLSALRGKQHVLLAFFPVAFTSTCTAELCAFSEDYSVFAGQDVAVVPISGDAVPSLVEFKTKYRMSVDLASDIRRDVARAYGVLNEERFTPRRAYILVDKQGIVRWAFVETKSGARRENSEILAEIAKLRS